MTITDTSFVPRLFAALATAFMLAANPIPAFADADAEVAALLAKERHLF